MSKTLIAWLAAFGGFFAMAFCFWIGGAKLFTFDAGFGAAASFLVGAMAAFAVKGGP